MCVSSVFAARVLVFGVTLFLVIILDQKSPVAVWWLPPHRERRSVEASLVELSLKTHLSVATSSLCAKKWEMRVGGAQNSGFSSVFGVPKKFSGEIVTAAKFFLTVDRDNKRKNLVRDMKEKERMRRALLSCAASQVSVETLVLDMVCLWSEGAPSSPLCHLVVFVVLREFSMRCLTLARVWKVLLNCFHVPS